jgi:hypothetical protein
MLDPSSQLAARPARDGDPEPIDFEETDTNYAIGWKGNYRIEGRAFVYIDRKSGRITTILGYPTTKRYEGRSANQATHREWRERRKISNMFG